VPSRPEYSSAGQFSVARAALPGTLLHAALLLGMNGGCEHTVVLGTDCPQMKAQCSADESPALVGEPKDDATAEAGASELIKTDDAGSSAQDSGNKEREAAVERLDAGPGDAQADALVSTDAFVPLAIANASFERNGGLSGDVVLGSVLSKVTAITTPIIVIFAELPNWYACWPGTVSSVSREPLFDAGMAPQQADYLYFGNINGTPVRQMLPAPMQPGVSYALEMDVLSQPDTGTHLMVEVRGASNECGVGALLGSSKPIDPEGKWTTTCVEFKSGTAYPYLLVSPGYEGPSPSLSTRLSLDSIRQVSSCPK
jgi:hypothetical protein